jgi:hypothetical protein
MSRGLISQPSAGEIAQYGGGGVGSAPVAVPGPPVPYDYTALAPTVLLLPASTVGSPVTSWASTGSTGALDSFTSVVGQEPAAGAVDGQSAAVFVAGADQMNGRVISTAMISAAAYSMLMVIGPTAATGNGAGAYSYSTVVGDAGGYIAVGVYASGTGYKVRVLHYAGTERTVDSAEYPFGTPVYVEVVYNGASVSLRVAAAAASTVAAASLTGGGNARLGFGYNGANGYAGSLAFLFSKNAALSAGDLALARNGILTYFPSLVV